MYIITYVTTSHDNAELFPTTCESRANRKGTEMNGSF